MHRLTSTQFILLSRPPGAGRGFVRDFVEQWRGHRTYAAPFTLGMPRRSRDAGYWTQTACSP